MSNMPLREFLERWKAGEFTRTRESMCEAGWYDWFCRDESLWNRLNKMTGMLFRIAESDKINKDTMYVFFKNNCPMIGGTYDDFRICDLESGDVLWTVQPRSPQGKGKRVYRRGRFVQSVIYRTEVWDFTLTDEEKTALHIENLAQGIPVDYEEQVVIGYKKDAYRYFGV